MADKYIGEITAAASANGDHVLFNDVSDTTAHASGTPKIETKSDFLSGKANSTHTHVATTDLTATGTKDNTTFLRGDNTWAVPAGGGGSTETVVGTMMHFEGQNAGSYNQTTTGSAASSPGRAASFTTGTTANSYISVDNTSSTDPTNFEGFHIWETNFRVSCSMTNTNTATDGLIVWGAGGGTMSASSFSPFRFVGFTIERTAGVDVFKAINSNNTSTTSTTLTNPVYPRAQHWYFSILKTQASVKFYMNGALVATHTTNVPTSATTHHQSSPIYIGVGNKTSAAAHRISLYSHRLDFVLVS